MKRSLPADSSTSEDRARRRRRQPRLDVAGARVPGKSVRGRLQLPAATGIVVLAWLGWAIVSTAARTESAPADLVERAEQKLKAEPQQADLDQIEAAANQALRSNPLESGALRVLGLVAEKRGDSDRAALLMRSAVARNIRDVKSQGWLFVRAAQQGDFESATHHLDAMLRARPEIGEAMLPALVELATMEAARSALLERLATNPSWRTWFLVNVARETPDPRVLSSIYTELKSAPIPLSDVELSAFLDRLVAKGFYDLAYLNWITSVSPARLATIGWLTNGAFEEPITRAPFDWQIRKVRGAETDISYSGAANRALRVSFLGTRVPYAHVSQILLLPGGHYRFSGRVRSIGFKNSRGLWWRMVCADTGDALGATDRVMGSVPWTDFNLTFTVPEGRSCRGQVLRLELAARIPAERQASGEIWYDDLEIARLTSDEIAAPANSSPPGGIRE
jgi:cytochrome c-type biogenesis protein CcmH/NrfG